jgi:hypothetical protein
VAGLRGAAALFCAAPSNRWAELAFVQGWCAPPQREGGPASAGPTGGGAGGGAGAGTPPPGGAPAAGQGGVVAVVLLPRLAEASFSSAEASSGASAGGGRGGGGTATPLAEVVRRELCSLLHDLCARPAYRLGLTDAGTASAASRLVARCQPGRPDPDLAACLYLLSRCESTHPALRRTKLLDAARAGVGRGGLVTGLAAPSSATNGGSGGPGGPTPPGPAVDSKEGTGKQQPAAGVRPGTATASSASAGAALGGAGGEGAAAPAGPPPPLRPRVHMLLAVAHAYGDQVGPRVGDKAGCLMQARRDF